MIVPLGTRHPTASWLLSKKAKVTCGKFSRNNLGLREQNRNVSRQHLTTGARRVKERERAGENARTREEDGHRCDSIEVTEGVATTKLSPNRNSRVSLEKDNVHVRCMSFINQHQRVSSE
ncbi:hypothetical protein KQX54_018280 [Cotesia glomerata]|uniref:Uncharacterized protein n=1 Tax=Cotesia glomerata TaxID=32391 RepID=A0AAV7IGF3_COTGL|nr:hypothetical protein KQX54_018280 [Cotesia glomerata]